TDSEIADLCRRIYRQHQRALDLIFEHVPDLQQEVSSFLESLVNQEPSLELDYSSKSAVRFLPKTWDGIKSLREGAGWSRSRRLMMFEFKNFDRLGLYLIIGPGPQAARERLYSLAQANPQAFRGRSSKLYPKWTTIWQASFLSESVHEESSLEDLEPKLKARWKKFTDKECPVIERLVSDAFSEQG
ncbi:MAG TPA: hypothetical protein VLV83_15375, partial [Acidobacteriota bacterium]|nr:hypothetical protein [Acidobacteriota bacterium]